MPIDGVRPNTAASGKTGIVPGQTAMPAEVVEARVAAILDDGVVRFNTAYGPLDLAVDQAVSVGDRARIMIENTGAKLTLTLIGLTATPEGSPAAVRTTAAGAAQPGASAQIPSPAAAPRTVPRPLDEQARAVQAMARAAAATQTPATALFARLSAVVATAAGGLPPEVRTAAQQLLGQGLRLDTAPDAAALREAVRRSGLFHEALAARTGEPPADMKQALTALRAALAAWSPSSLSSPQATASAGQVSPAATALPENGDGTSPSPGTASPGQSSGPPSGVATPSPVLAGATVTGPNGTRPTGVPAQVAGPEADAAGRRPAATNGQPPSGGAPAATPDLPSLPPALLRQLVARAFGAPDAVTRQEGHSQERLPALPRADVAPRASPPERAPVGFTELAPQELREALLSATDGAIDRLKLTQYASLPREGAGLAPAPVPQQQMAAAHAMPPAWVLDVPLLSGQEAALAQMRVTRDGRGSGGHDEPDGPSWSIDVALDTTETGPIHARLRLGGGRLGVTLWAERNDVAERLRQDMPALRRTLDDAAFSVDDVAILTGAPTAAARTGAAAGYLLDTRS